MILDKKKLLIAFAESGLDRQSRIDKGINPSMWIRACSGASMTPRSVGIIARALEVPVESILSDDWDPDEDNADNNDDNA